MPANKLSMLARYKWAWLWLVFWATLAVVQFGRTRAQLPTSGASTSTDSTDKTKLAWRSPDWRSPGDKSKVAWKAIEKIHVGERVVAKNPDHVASTPSHVDISKWRFLRLMAEVPWDDGTIDRINVETLQPPEWVAENDAHVGADVPLPVDLVEMGLPEGIPARVLANEPCPALAKGIGQLVLTTVNHLNQFVLELTVRNGDGVEAKFKPTGYHKFYREPEGAWVSACDLRPGDRLRGTHGDVVIVGVNAVAGVHRVYNLSVETEHVYFVSQLGILTHNTGCRPHGFSSWAAYLHSLGTDALGMAKPSNMKVVLKGKSYDVHAHHIVMKVGPQSARADVQAAQKILNDHGINPFTAKQNLVWGPNCQHTNKYAKDVHDRLKAVVDRGGDVKKSLTQELKDIATDFNAGKWIP